MNDGILAALGGMWDVPPTRLRSALRGRRLAPLRARAEQIVTRMRTHAPWGWKDPRTSLTLPFWLPIVPELHVVVCYRDVVAVAHSLAHRGHSSELFGMRLWTKYNRRLLRAAPRSRTFIAAYESFFEDAEQKIERLVAGLGLPVDADAIARAAATVDRTMRHHAVDYDPNGLPRTVARCRPDILALAGC